MTKIMKKASSILLALAMVITMIPFVAAPAFAETQEINVYVNGNATNISISAEYLNNQDNWEDPQIFSFLGQKGGTYAYDVVEGPSIENALREAGLDITKLENATIAFNSQNNTGEVQDSNGYNISVEDLLNAKDLVEVLSSDGTPITVGSFKNASEDLYVSRIEDSEDLVPIIAVKQMRCNNYAEAKAKLDAWDTASAEATELQTPYLGGNVSEDVYLCHENGSTGQTMGLVNWNGKFATGNCNSFSFYIRPVVNMSSVKLTSTKEVAAKTPFSSEEKSLLGNNISYYSSDESVAKVSKTTGKITPVDNGKCVIKIRVASKIGMNPQDLVAAKYNLTVDFNPAKVTSLKVKNIKKHAAKISWKKVSNATGYYVYRKKSGSKSYSKIKTITKGSTDSFTNKNLSKNKKYYYKVRAYRVVNGKTYVGTFSSAKSVKIKK